MIREVDADLQDSIGEAADWYLQLRDAKELSTEQLRQWAEWFAEPHNQAAMEAVGRVAPERGLTKRPELLPPEQVWADPYDGSLSVDEWRALQQKPAEAVSPERARRGLRPRFRTPLAVAAAVVVGLVLVVSSYLRFIARAPITIYSTAVGEHRDIVLSDGSKITLGARSVLTVRYTAKRRATVLSDGEALFSVAHDRDRPFTVLAGNGIIAAIGTRFDVRSNLDRVTVTVTEGTVDVTPSQESSSNRQTQQNLKAWEPARLIQGQQVTYVGNERRSAVEVADPGATEWVTGRLQYRQVPLGYVAADVERYIDKKITVGDSAAKECIFTGTIYQNRVEDWLYAVQKIFPVEVSQSNVDHIVIRLRLNATANCGAASR